MQEKNLIKELLGIDKAPTPVQTASSVIGTLLFGGGFLGAWNANKQQKDFGEATRYEQEQIGLIGPAADVRATKAQTELAADLAGYQSKTEAGIKQGLINRGITDPNIGIGAAGQVKAGLSGAYAQARSALSMAKLNAGRAVSGALSTYQQALAQKQYESQVAKYYANVGLWGALGGFGINLATLPGKDKVLPQTPTLLPRSPIGTDERGSV